jgi:hypothetical protein
MIKKEAEAKKKEGIEQPQMSQEETQHFLNDLMAKQRYA